MFSVGDKVRLTERHWSSNGGDGVDRDSWQSIKAAIVAVVVEVHSDDGIVTIEYTVGNSVITESCYYHEVEKLDDCEHGWDMIGY